MHVRPAVARIDDAQFAQAEVAHRARGHADVLAELRLDQHDDGRCGGPRGASSLRLISHAQFVHSPCSRDPEAAVKVIRALPEGKTPRLARRLGLPGYA